MANSDSYDAIIIGAGIGGLVCGCYLAKAGVKVLICEQHYKPGGYCTSFKRGQFTFDAAAHSFGGYKSGHVGKVFEELGIKDTIKINKVEPSDLVITPDYKISFSNFEKTLDELIRAFPKEKQNITTFFSLIYNTPSNIFIQMRHWTFTKLLDKYFKDRNLISILSFPLFGNTGMPPSLLSAFIGIKVYKEFLLDGGYYPEGGMQTLADILAKKFIEEGGELRLSCLVTQIVIYNRKVEGIIINKENFIPSKYVISNCDAKQTFLKLINRNTIDIKFMNKLTKMIPSLSAFILYLGLDNKGSISLLSGNNLWYLLNYNLDSAYLSVKKGDFSKICGYLIHASPDKNTVTAYFNVPFKTRDFWHTNKKRLIKYFTRKIEETLIPDLTKNVIFKDAATPLTLHRYTKNYKGAAFGWASMPSQIADFDFKKPPFINNLYLTGHWTTHGLGIPGVVYDGYDTAKLILKKK
jgi:phytoene dehydrogenase-like protein